MLKDPCYSEDDMIATRQKGFNDGMLHAKMSSETKLEFVRHENLITTNAKNIVLILDSQKTIQGQLESVKRWLIGFLFSSILAVGGTMLMIGDWKGKMEIKIEHLQIALDKHIE